MAVAQAQMAVKRKMDTPKDNDYDGCTDSSEDESDDDYAWKYLFLKAYDKNDDVIPADNCNLHE